MPVSLLNANVKTIVAKLCKSLEAPDFHMPKCQLSIFNFHTTFPFILGTWDLTIAITFNYHRTCSIEASKTIDCYWSKQNNWTWMLSGSSTCYAHYTPTSSEQLQTPHCVSKLGQRKWQVLWGWRVKSEQECVCFTFHNTFPTYHLHDKARLHSVHIAHLRHQIFGSLSLFPTNQSQ